jgi:hypothetical protein
VARKRVSASTMHAKRLIKAILSSVAEEIAESEISRSDGCVDAMRQRKAKTSG